MLRLAVITCLWRRHKLAAFVLRRLARIRAEIASDGIDLTVIAVGSEGETTAKLAASCGVGYLERPNDPRGAKWNAALTAGQTADGRLLREVVDAVVITGSDDLLTADLFRAWAARVRDGAVFCGLLDCYVLRTADLRMVHWHGYSGGPRVGETIGTGRCISRSLLELLGWELWPETSTLGLDAAMMRRFRNVMPDFDARGIAVRMADIGAVVIDVKSEPDTDIGHFSSFAFEDSDEVAASSVLESLPNEEVEEFLVLFDPVPKDGPIFRSAHPRVSAAMMVRNEAAGLEKCLRSIRGVVDEVVIVDTGSTDKTMEIARALGATVVEQAWKSDFSFHRNHSISLARGEWVFIIDGDEVLTEAGNLRATIESAQRDGTFDSVTTRIDARSAEGSIDRFWSIRAFRRDAGRYVYPIHNQLTGLSKTADSTALISTSYLGSMRQKARRSIPMLLEFAAANPDNAHAPYYLARSYRTISEMAECLKWARRCIELAPDEMIYSTVWVDLAYATIAEKGLDAADDVCMEATRKWPRLMDLWHIWLTTVGIRWFQAAIDPGGFVRLPNQSWRFAMKFPEWAKELGLPVKFDSTETGGAPK